MQTNFSTVSTGIGSLSETNNKERKIAELRFDFVNCYIFVLLGR